MMNSAKPWRDAPLDGRVLMLCEGYEHGVDRREIARRLGVMEILLARPLRRLVEGGWLLVDHPHEKPTSESVYRLVRDRAGLSELKKFWYVEHGFTETEFGLFVRNQSKAPDPDAELISDALASSPAGVATVDARVYRSLLCEVDKQRSRSAEVWNRLQEMYSAIKEERARDLIHMPPYHSTSFPGPDARGPRVSRELFELAVACRRAAQEDARKWRWLMECAEAATSATSLRARLIGRGRHAAMFAPFMEIGPWGPDHALREGITAAMATLFQEQRIRYGAVTNVGRAGDVMIAFTYRDMARCFEDIAQRIIALPEVSAVASSEAGMQLLGAAPDLSVPESPWEGVEPVGTLEPLTMDASADDATIKMDGGGGLIEGDWITGVEGTPLRIPVLVGETSKESQTVDLAVSGGSEWFRVPLDLVERCRLQVRRAQVQEAAPGI